MNKNTTDSDKKKNSHSEHTVRIEKEPLERAIQKKLQNQQKLETSRLDGPPVPVAEHGPGFELETKPLTKPPVQQLPSRLTEVQNPSLTPRWIVEFRDLGIFIGVSIKSCSVFKIAGDVNIS